MDRNTVDMNSSDEATQMEINICNTDSRSHIVLNDLQLLELLYSYPFLFSKAVHAHGDKDYEEWGWQEVAKKFNLSYKGLELNTPFTVEELQWRWEVLRPVCPSLGKACGQIPDVLWYIICKINRLLNVKTPAHIQRTSAPQKLILNQLPMIEKLTETQQRRLEVEVLDAILTHERNIHLDPLSKKAENIVQTQYDNFLRAIRVKELPSSDISEMVLVSLTNNSNTTNTLVSTESNLEVKELPSDISSETSSVRTNDNSNSTNIVNSSECNLVISSVCRLLKSQDEGPINQPATPPLEIQPAAENQQEGKQEPTPGSGTEANLTNELELRFVPLKSAKYYTKRVVVRLKRLNLDKYMPRSRGKLS
ncbi:uncharacterized protein LOC117784320 [Drosophila innubila]|uniref:uncharacterized protein LOC117784320 n=1 Tax=Drosophila innubila TaxID=198719 RepID=UPI00148B35ED|nr:uncharacterized protein LOC117784320 [Drosophila innubila]